MHKHKSLTERPKPPQFSDIIQDIDNAPDDDVVFSSYFNADDSKDTNKTISMEESYLEISEMNNEDQTPQEEAYRQALQLIQLQKKLQSAPKQLQEQFEKLQELETDVSKSIHQLKESSDALKDKS